MKADDFRKELTKLLPGYNWTVHRSISPKVMSATGIQSSGFNRLSTIEVIRRNEGPWYEVKGFGYGLRSPVMGRGAGGTLAKAVRALQDYYGSQARKYACLHGALNEARKEGGAG